MAAEGQQLTVIGGRSQIVSRGSRRASERIVYAVLFAAFAGVAAQLLLLTVPRHTDITLAVSEPVSATSFSRPDIVDRNGRLLATDLEAPSIFADPGLVIDRDEVVEKLSTVLPDLNGEQLLRDLADKSRRFMWVRRGVSPGIAQKVHDLGLPGISFRYELKRAYPGGMMAGHVLGYTDVDNRGVAGIERYIDDKVGVDPVHSAVLSSRPPVRLSLDIGVQHALEDELDDAGRRYKTDGAAGVVLNIKTGEILASASLPRVDPSWPTEALDKKHIDRMAGGTYELGSVFKTLTLAMAFDEGLARPDTLLDVRQPLEAGRFTVTDFHPANRPLTVTEVYTHSSNVGAGMLALEAGPEKLQAFLKKLGLLDQMQTEEGPLAAPQLPPRWNRISTITAAFGHGIAVAPLQFAVAAATILNNGMTVHPTFLRKFDAGTADGKAVVGVDTSHLMAHLMRLNVVNRDGTGGKADVPGYRVGGKTGTADVAGKGGYTSNSVISSFLATFPTDDPQYLTFVILFEPKGVEATRGRRTAGVNAAPVTGELIARIAAQLGVAPEAVAASQ
ncbi:peptidoglycan D,D-transpeptidase FtsI family protein [Hyphomicrobium sp.]|jgi:cell division protein FtsI (penicillin-binding protein 3)|uniref:peptidoglycan D,D-transpeptidase FtsI family protein n=1 Tax=Hyphomicrobium sp. TaxID=82 RepID=UPI00356807B3